MSANKSKLVWPFLLGLGSLSGINSTNASAQETKKPFTVADDIAFTHFADGAYGNYEEDPVLFSPNGNFFAVLTAHGRLEADQVEESLRLYRTEDIESFLQRSQESQPPAPIWVLNRSEKKDFIINMRWLADSSGVAFLEQT